MDAFVLKRNDEQPSLAATLSDDGGAIVIPSGATVTFVMRKAGDDCGCGDSVNDGLMPGQNGYCNPPGSQVATAPKVSRQAVIVNGALGQVRYDWVPGDTDTAGNFSGEFKVNYAGLTTTYPSAGYIPIIINPDLS